MLDWLEAFIWAACMVLLANQYLLQAYVIPSGSMIDTMLVGDRIFVNKLVYGPELLPGIGKLPSPFKPQRNDIIIFENPSYISRGTAFDVAQRVIYMLTLSLVDIDRDENGEPSAHFLIKRAAGVGGDRFVADRGEMKILFSGDDRWTDERDYVAAKGWNHSISRLVNRDDYPAIETAAKTAAWMSAGLPVTPEMQAAVMEYERMPYRDPLAFETARLAALRTLMPYDGRYATSHARNMLGRYVPEGSIFPLGDNRDNSRDARYFGPVQLSNVLGKGEVIYWPMQRIGALR